MARGNFSQSHKWHQKPKRQKSRNSVSRTHSNLKSAGSQGAGTQFRIGRWFLLLSMLWIGYYLMNPNSEGSDPTSTDADTQRSHISANLAQPGLPHQSSMSSNSQEKISASLTRDTAQVKLMNTQDFKENWVESRKHLGQGFVLHEFVFPNEEAIWLELFFNGDTGTYYQDTLLTFLSEAWSEVVQKNTQNVSIKILKNSAGSIRYWSWRSDKWIGEFFKRDSSWVTEEGCPHNKLCRQPILKNGRYFNAKKNFKSEFWRSDSSLHIYAPFDGSIVEHSGLPSRGRMLVLSSYYGEELVMEGLGNLTPGLKVGSKVHKGMKLGTLLHQKKSLYTEYTNREGQRSWLGPLVKYKVDSSFQNRVNQIRKVLKRS